MSRIHVVLLLGVWVASACAPTLRPTAAPTPAALAALRERAGRDRTPETQIELGAALRAAGQRDSARALLSRVLAAHPCSAPAALYLGLTQEDLGDLGGAQASYRRYLATGRSATLKSQIRRRLELIAHKQMAQAARSALAQEAALGKQAPEPRTLAVFPFLFAGQDTALAPLTRALSSLLTTDLSQTERLRVLERANVQALLDEIALSGSGLVDSTTAVRSGRLLRAGHIVQGRIGGTDEELRIAAEVVATGGAAGMPAPPLELEDPVARLFEMEKRLALDVYRQLGIQLTVAERERVTRHATQNLQALLEFGWGLEAEDAGRFPEAAGHYSRAAALDATFSAAASHAQVARELAAAAATSTDQLAAMARAELLALPGLDLLLPNIPDEPVPMVGLRRIRVLLPDPIVRDAGSEILGIDGFALPGFLVIIPQRQ